VVALGPVVIDRLLVRADDALVVAQDDAVRCPGDDAVGHHRDLAAAVRCVDHVPRHSEAARVADQVLDDLDPLAHRRAEVRQTLGQVALVQIVGSDAIGHETFDELPHYAGAVVHPGQQDRLIAQRQPRVCQSTECGLRCGCDLVGVVEVRVQPQWVMG